MASASPSSRGRASPPPDPIMALQANTRALTLEVKRLADEQRLAARSVFTAPELEKKFATSRGGLLAMIDRHGIRVIKRKPLKVHARQVARLDDALAREAEAL